jgi:hypothetical protein
MASVLGLAFGGLVAGHWLAYAGADHAREAAAAAHGWLEPASRLGLVAAVAVLAAATLGALMRPAGTAVRPRSVVLRLFAFQCGAFLAIELTERLVAGTGLQDLPLLLPLGIAVQALIAVAGAWLLKAALRAGELPGALSVFRPARSALPLTAITPTTSWTAPTWVPAPVGIRAPPQSR